VHRCDWSEIKDNDIFYIEKEDSPGWTTKVGICQPLGIFLTQKRGYISLLDGNWLVRGHRLNPENARLKQEVVIVAPEEAKGVQMLGSIPTRVNGTTGTDPEIFVVRGAKHSLLPAFQFLPVQKLSPKGEYCDGFAAEYYTPPATCHGYLIDYIRSGLSRVLEKAQTFDRTAKLTLKNTFTIPAVTMERATEEQAALGCEPSLNAYNDSPQLPPNGREFRLRFAGGHVHLGMASLPANKAIDIVKACDVITALPAVAMFGSIDTPVRRQFYGRAGEYRQPAHGLEYRTLSNAWLTAPAVTHLIFNLVRAGAKIGWNAYNKYLEIPEEKTREIINFCDVKAAREWVMQNKHLYLQLLRGEGANGKNADKAFSTIIQGGIEALFPDYADIEKNWKLNPGATTWAGHSNNLQASWSYLCNNHKF
jgi:hypothetical protein